MVVVRMFASFRVLVTWASCQQLARNCSTSIAALIETLLHTEANVMLITVQVSNLLLSVMVTLQPGTHAPAHTSLQEFVIICHWKLAPLLTATHPVLQEILLLSAEQVSDLLCIYQLHCLKLAEIGRQRQEILSHYAPIMTGGRGQRPHPSDGLALADKLQAIGLEEYKFHGQVYDAVFYGVGTADNMSSVRHGQKELQLKSSSSMTAHYVSLICCF